jgi:Tol biopolymer transport system component
MGPGCLGLASLAAFVGVSSTESMARRRLATWLTVGLVGVVAIAAVTTALLPGEGSDRAGQGSSSSLTTASGGTTTPADEPPNDSTFFLDLRTGEATPLAAELADGFQFAASRDRTMLAFVRADDKGSPQIFIARIDGSGVRQLTHEPIGALSPAWSPDGTSIAFVGSAARNLFVLDLTTGEATQITHDTRDLSDPQFTPDGSSLIYTEGGSSPDTWIMPADGREKAKLLIRLSRGLTDAGNASLSPDGSLVTFLGGGSPISGHGHCGPCRLVANADGTERRVIGGDCWSSHPAGTWSPDGSRIVCSSDTGSIIVLDIATGEGLPVASGTAAIWLDGHTLLVENEG